MKFGHSPEFCVCVGVCVCMREREREMFAFNFNLWEKEKCSLKALIQKTLNVEWLYLHLNLLLRVPLIADVTLPKLSNLPEPELKEVLGFCNNQTFLV